MKSRVVAILDIVHQAADQQPVPYSPRGRSCWLESDEQPYHRLMPLTGTPQVLDTGWVSDPYMVVLVADEKHELRVDSEVVPPGMFTVRYTKDLTVCGEGKVTVLAFQR